MHVKQQNKLSSSVKVRFINVNEVIEELRSIARKILKKDPNVIGIYLFGSLAKGNCIPASDADILIMLNRGEKRFIDRIPRFLRHFLNAPIAVDVFPYTKKELDEMINCGHLFITKIWKEKIVLAER